MVGGAGGESHPLPLSTAPGPGGLAPGVPGLEYFAACGGELLSGCPERSQRGTGGGRRGTEPAAPALPQCRPPPGPPFYGGRQLGGMAGRRKGAGGMGIDVASPTAAAAWVGFPAWWFLCLKARLCAWWGTSSSVVEGVVTSTTLGRWLRRRRRGRGIPPSSNVHRTRAQWPGGVAPGAPGLEYFAACGGELLSGCPERSQRGTGRSHRSNFGLSASFSMLSPPWTPCFTGAAN